MHICLTSFFTTFSLFHVFVVDDSVLEDFCSPKSASFFGSCSLYWGSNLISKSTTAVLHVQLVCQDEGKINHSQDPGAPMQSQNIISEKPLNWFQIIKTVNPTFYCVDQTIPFPEGILVGVMPYNLLTSQRFISHLHKKWRLLNNMDNLDPK